MSGLTSFHIGSSLLGTPARPITHLVFACALLLLAGVRPLAAEERAGVTPSAAAFQAFIAALWPDAERQGIPRATFDAAFDGVTPDPSLAPLTQRQPEFAKPIGVYLASQVTAGRVTAGRQRSSRWRPELASLAERTGVPASIVTAVWGLETNYGAAAGNKDVIRSLATLAAMNFRPTLTRPELLAALTLLKDGDVPRAALRGSWAGAMGQPQFMPSSFERYAVDGDGDGRRDIWTSVPDTLASIANFLRLQGWQASVPWGFEVRLPPGFDPADSRASFTVWRTRGVTRTDGGDLPNQGDGILLFPAGADGPAFLVTENYEVLKTYNFSDAYVLSIGLLAARLDGGAGFRGSWPPLISMPRQDRIALQTRLASLGYPVDNREGRISLAFRDIVRAAQKRVGQVADGNPTDALLLALDHASPR